MHRWKALIEKGKRERERGRREGRRAGRIWAQLRRARVVHAMPFNLIRLKEPVPLERRSTHAKTCSELIMSPAGWRTGRR